MQVFTWVCPSVPTISRYLLLILMASAVLLALPITCTSLTSTSTTSAPSVEVTTDKLLLLVDLLGLSNHL